MDEYEVNCVDKPNHNSPHEAITHIGHRGHGWRITYKTAISFIESGIVAFYFLDKVTGKRVYIGVVREAGRAPHLRAQVEGGWSDGLLGLGACGEGCRVI